MVTLDWELERSDGVTLVEVYVTAQRRRRVRVANRLDGPVWPPRRHGQPADGWDDGTIEGVVEPDDRLVAGYATPAAPAEPPVELVGDEPVTDDPDVGDPPACGSIEETPAGVVRSLGDPVVPRDAVPVPDDGPDPSGHTEPSDPTPASPAEEGAGRGGDTDARSEAGECHTAATRAGGTPGTPSREQSGDNDRSPERAPRSAEATGDPRPAAREDLVVPGPVRAWLADVERRVVAAERGHDVGSGSTLGTVLAGDRRSLEHVGRRVDRLAERADAVASGGERPPDDR